ncbi:MAG: N-acetyltransferase [Acidimicrobiia bacterium]|nr:N-acetyltransferase [Acidimicrobiia bacterium]
MSVEIRLETPEDHADVRRVIAAAFDPEPVADLVEAIRASEQYEPELVFVALADGRIVGHVMISYATLETADGDHRVAMLSPLAVEPEFQRQGIGTKLVHCALDKARLMGDRMVVLEGDPSYYGRFGFEPSHLYGITLPLPSWATIDAGQVVWLSEPQRFDSATVVYPPAFESVSE